MSAPEMKLVFFHVTGQNMQFMTESKDPQRLLVTIVALDSAASLETTTALQDVLSSLGYVSSVRTAQVENGQVLCRFRHTQFADTIFGIVYTSKASYSVHTISDDMWKRWIHSTEASESLRHTLHVYAKAAAGVYNPLPTPS